MFLILFLIYFLLNLFLQLMSKDSLKRAIGEFVTVVKIAFDWGLYLSLTCRFFISRQNPVAGSLPMDLVS